MTQALAEWKKLRASASDVGELEKQLTPGKAEVTLKPPTAQAQGRFVNLPSFRLRWVAPQVFLFVPKHEPFAFIRPNKRIIEPRANYTDGGSVPRLLRLTEALDPWGYGPAFVLHDWAYNQHHDEVARGLPHTMTFEDANHLLVEAIEAQIALGLAPSPPLARDFVALAVASPFARAMWDRKPKVSPLPPDFTDCN